MSIKFLATDISRFFVIFATYSLFASFVTIPDTPKAINSNGFSVSPGKSRWVLGMVLAKISSEWTKLVEFELNLS
jgi:hypothetical protein